MTQWNASRRFQGRTDVPLSDEGRAQAQALAAALGGVSFETAFSSPLQRARETAEIVAAGRVAVAADERLLEFDFGAWEGLTWDEITARFPEAASAAYTDARNYQPTGGERFDHVVARAQRFLGSLAADSGNVLVVTHAGVLHAMLAALERRFAEPPGGVVFSTASLTRIAMDGAVARIITLNDVRHHGLTRQP